MFSDLEFRSSLLPFLRHLGSIYWMDANLAVPFLINSYFGFPLFFRQTKNWNLCLWIILLMYGRVGCLMALPYKNAGLQIANFAWWVFVLIFNADLYWSEILGNLTVRLTLLCWMVIHFYMENDEGMWCSGEEWTIFAFFI